MPKFPIRKLDPEKSYYLMPLVVEAEQLTEDTEIETDYHGTFTAKAGSYIVSIYGTPTSVVSEEDFKKNYVKHDMIPENIRGHFAKILKWKLDGHV